MAAHAISSAPRPARRITDDTARPIVHPKAMSSAKNAISGKPNEKIE